MKLKRIMDWIRSHKRQAIFIVIVLAVIFCIGIAVAVMLGIKGGSEELSGKAPEKTAVSAENEPADIGTAIYSSAGTTQQTDASGAESTSSDSEAKEGQTREPGASSETATASKETAHPSYTDTVTDSGSTSHSSSHVTSRPNDVTDHPSSGTEGGETPHVHTWVSVSPENSGHMEYGAECRIHGANGEEPMFFRTLNDLYLHQAADGCMSGWGTGFKGLAFKYCSGCGEEVITGHVHDFGTVAKEVYFEKVVCECGMSFTAGKDYTALESWHTHVDSYTSHGDPKENHDDYQIVKSSVTRYEATKTCTFGWRPVDKTPVY